MATRYIFTQEESSSSVCSSSGGASTMNSQVRSPSRNSSSSSPPNLLIRIAMKISRSRCYSFLRRVFHYQNGYGSNLGPNPFDSPNWMLMEFMALIIQITLTISTLLNSQSERPVWPMRFWISGYTIGCFFNLILLCFRYHIVHLSRFDPLSDLEEQRNHDDSRRLQLLHRCRTSVELLFAIWFVMGNVWVFDSRFGSFHGAPKLHVLCIALLAWNAVSYSFPFILFVLLCCCVPLLGSFLGYNMNTASLRRGATEEQLDCLPSWKYEVVLEKNHDEVQECCICLVNYKDKEEIRQLPCTHIFHLKCVDQWLRIIPCCPLCKQGIEK